MQPKLFTNVTEVAPAIKFACVVNGKNLKAKITHTEDDGLHVHYHVVFSDGHKASYVPGDIGLQDGFERPRVLDAYEAAIFDDLIVIPGLKNGGLYSNVCVNEDGCDSFNVWIRKRNDFYSVYYKGKYHFTLRKRMRWEVSTIREKGYLINQAMASLIANYIAPNLI